MPFRRAARGAERALEGWPRRWDGLELGEKGARAVWALRVVGWLLPAMAQPV